MNIGDSVTTTEDIFNINGLIPNGSEGVVIYIDPNRDDYYCINFTSLNEDAWVSGSQITH